MKSFIIVSDKDNVATALRNFKKGEEVANIRLKNDIASGHKFALKDIKANEAIIKYAEVIASANCDIKTGEWVHVHNISGIRGRGDKE
ncbi:UxaA family hydrolase [Campylobacter sp. RM10532]|uniref:UxaA family hydrolase n=1 Tax=Campylobacter molothri TaxID=1032242 RepID=A0ACC5W0E1_9BACT|nr:UxaA family hydrolase [Campylobacter sp. RM10542]MBZ7929421.1 UxaA family hydrolase [Campylobacter sp. W0067]MBZ7931548.1 UxaA family hydrolase [Campylobacter sp. RM12910]MBZ7932856.1 UxaA family hydrolase [Campylobacter sp. RM10543]MBZ7933939.1 UxaA family hydrolase [Campylobacter sp. W0065]MBZ7937222.1 UxaA family hydrolase [Campylobacter sp. RM10538]MBZ7944688.1 UxaA family hydrolase [Campylobacter sp. RM10532]MBZ7958266.1 UxaA family hydrolase [Campylobacter sp. RM9760]MBZ7962313.1 U